MNIINKKVNNYLSDLKIPKTSRIIITDLEKTIFDTKLNNNNEVSKELLKFLILNKNSTKIYETKNIKVFEYEKAEKQYKYKIIVPIKIQSVVLFI